MRALVVYESIFGNTQQVAQAIAEGLREADAEVELSEVSEAAGKLDGAELIVLGGPVHAWSMTRPSTRRGARDQAAQDHIEPVSPGIGIREFLDELGAEEGKPVAVATFDTALQHKWVPSGSAAKPAARRLKKRGYHLIAKPEHFYVEDSEGPLRAGEAERARTWAKSLIEGLRANV